MIESTWAALTLTGIAISFILGAVDFIKTVLTNLSSIAAKAVSFISTNIIQIIGGVAIFLALVSVAINIWDSYDEFKLGNITNGILSCAMAFMER